MHIIHVLVLCNAYHPCIGAVQCISSMYWCCAMLCWFAIDDNRDINNEKSIGLKSTDPWGHWPLGNDPWVHWPLGALTPGVHWPLGALTPGGASVTDMLIWNRLFDPHELMVICKISSHPTQWWFINTETSLPTIYEQGVIYSVEMQYLGPMTAWIICCQWRWTVVKSEKSSFSRVVRPVCRLDGLKFGDLMKWLEMRDMSRHSCIV